MNEIDISCPSSWSCLCSRQMKSMLWCFPASTVVLWRASVLAFSRVSSESICSFVIRLAPECQQQCGLRSFGPAWCYSHSS